MKDPTLDKRIMQLKASGKLQKEIAEILNKEGHTTTALGKSITKGWVASRISYLRYKQASPEERLESRRKYRKKLKASEMMTIPVAQDTSKIALILGTREEIIEILKGWAA